MSNNGKQTLHSIQEEVKSNNTSGQNFFTPNKQINLHNPHNSEVSKIGKNNLLNSEVLKSYGLERQHQSHSMRKHMEEFIQKGNQSQRPSSR